MIDYDMKYLAKKIYENIHLDDWKEIADKVASEMVDWNEISLYKWLIEDSSAYRDMEEVMNEEMVNLYPYRLKDHIQKAQYHSIYELILEERKELDRIVCEELMQEE